MKFRLRKTFAIQVSPTQLTTYPAGDYQVPEQMLEDHARKAEKQHLGRFVAEKKAPENKVVNVPNDKAAVRKKTVRRGGPRSKSDT